MMKRIIFFLSSIATVFTSSYGMKEAKIELDCSTELQLIAGSSTSSPQDLA